MQNLNDNTNNSLVLSPSNQMMLLELKLRYLDCKDLQTIPEVDDEHYFSFLNGDDELIESEVEISCNESLCDLESGNLSPRCDHQNKFSRLNTIHSLGSQMPGTESELGETLVMDNKSATDFTGIETQESIYFTNVANSCVSNSRTYLKEIDKDIVNTGICFDITDKGTDVSLASPVTAESRPVGDLLIFKAPMEDNRTYKFKVVNKSSPFLAIGACQRSIVKAKRFYMKKNGNKRHGCFMFRADGYRFRSGSSHSYHFWSTDYVKMNSDDEVLLKLVKSKRSLYMLNIRSGIKAKLAINAEVNFDDFYPCIYLPCSGEEVDVIPFAHQFGKLIDPNHIKQNPNYSLCSNRISRLPRGDLALLTTSITPYVEYKFRIQSKPSHDMAIGICMKSLAHGNGYLVGSNRNHGCWLFYPDGDIQIQGEQFRRSTQGSEVPFAQGNDLTLTYNSENAQLSLLNLSTGKSASIMLRLRQSLLKNFHPCVRLGRAGDKVSLIN